MLIPLNIKNNNNNNYKLNNTSNDNILNMSFIKLSIQIH